MITNIFMKYYGKYYKKLNYDLNKVISNNNMQNIYNVFNNFNYFVFNYLIIELCIGNLTDVIMELFELPTFVSILNSYLDKPYYEQVMHDSTGNGLSVSNYITEATRNNNLNLIIFFTNRIILYNNNYNNFRLKQLYKIIIREAISFNESFVSEYYNDNDDDDELHGYYYCLIYTDKNNIFYEQIIRWIYNNYDLYEPNKSRMTIINEYGFTKFVLKKALKCCSFEVIKWLINIGCDYDNNDLLIDAGLYERIDVINWIAMEKPDITINLRSIHYCNHINKVLNPETFKYLLDKYNYTIDINFWDEVFRFYDVEKYNTLRTLYNMPSDDLVDDL